MRAVYRQLLSGTVNMEAVKGYSRDLYALIREVLERGIRRQEFVSELSLEALTRHFVMAIRGLTYEWCIRYPDLI
jgi:benzoyl-CoA reductase/2-hydroxyglutaryl-CoA dehydratase subunit BcrC/BadD/HgdB